MAPSVWEKDSLASIKAGDYEEAVKITKRGLVEKPGNRKLQTIFLAATALTRSADNDSSWFKETVTEGPSRYIADMNIVSHLAEAKDLWVDGETRQKAVDAAQEELREIRKGFASKGMTLEDVKDLKDLGRNAAKAFLALKLDSDKHEIQRATLAANKTLLLLGDKEGVTGVLKACETAKNLDRWERVTALRAVGAKDIDALKKVAFDKDHSLFKDARIALTLSLWDSEEGYGSLKSYEQAKLKQPDGTNWDEFAFLADTETAKHKRWQGKIRNSWNTDQENLVGAVFAWSVPLLKKGDSEGVGVVARVGDKDMKVIPVEKFVPFEKDIRLLMKTEEVKSGEPNRLAIHVANRQEVGTAYRDQMKYSAWRGFYNERVPYQTLTSVKYWAILNYNASTKRMELQGYRKGENPFDKDLQNIETLPPTPADNK